MRIGYDLRFAHLPCGSWPYVSNLIRLMSAAHPQDSWRVYYNPFSPPQQRIVDLLREQEAGLAERADRYRWVPVRHPCLTWRHHLEFARFHDDGDLYHYLHFDMPLGMRGLPLVVTVHDLYPLVLEGYCSSLKARYFRMVTAYNMKRAARIITVSHNTRRDIVNHFDIDPDKITVIHQGYSPEFRPIQEEEWLAAVRVKYKLGGPFILYTGNHKRHKNLERLLRAYARLSKPSRKFDLVLTGPLTAETQELKQLAEKLGISRQLRFLGLVEYGDLPALYNLASLFVLPSLYEGFGIPLVEAMACGTPVVCSSGGAMPEVVGDCARLFDPGDVGQMAEALDQALTRDLGDGVLRQRLLARAGQFTWDRCAGATYEVYRQAANLPPCPATPSGMIVETASPQPV